MPWTGRSAAARCASSRGGAFLAASDRTSPAQSSRPERERPGSHHVFGAAGFAAGAFGEAVITKEKYLTAMPDGVSFEQAATLPVAGLTALQALNKARIGPGHRVFISGVQGGVGQFAAQLAALRGATVTGSARDVNAAQDAGLPVDQVVPFDFNPELLKPGFDLVFDTAGKLPTATSRQLVRGGGQVIDIVPSATKMLRIIRYRQFKGHMGSLRSSDLDVLGRLVASGDLHVAIARTVPLKDAIDALTELEQHGTPKGGKLVVTP
jgi:NADPH:quinone reductase-like Zn-dependent oxidoreductase